MIVFDLKCTCGYQFEGWFESRDDFREQNYNSHIFCPECGGSDIHKILSPIAVHTGNVNQPPSSCSSMEHNEITEETTQQFLVSVQEFVEKNFDDVGPKLAEESLKIQYGVSEPRNIRGVATADEEKMLIEEGVELLKIPIIKKSSNTKIN